LNFDVDILAILVLPTVLATFSKIWLIFFQSSGHLGSDYAKELSSILLSLAVPNKNTARSSSIADRALESSS
jgi:hypothetical protein